MKVWALLTHTREAILCFLGIHADVLPHWQGVNRCSRCGRTWLDRAWQRRQQFQEIERQMREDGMGGLPPLVNPREE